MRISRLRFSLPTLLIAATTILAAGVLAASFSFTEVPSAQPKAPGLTSPNFLPQGLTEVLAAQGSNPLENPVDRAPFPAGCPTLGSGGLTFAAPGTPASTTMLSIGFYGYDTTLNGAAFVDGPMMPAPGDLPSDHRNEATKTEPDENTYLILHNQVGPDPHYNYGTHFLFQGHELGRGYITRINLDADGPHRVTLMATTVNTATPIPAAGVRVTPTGSQSCPIPIIDGSGWDPFAHKLLFTSETLSNQSIMQVSPEFGSIVEDLTPWMGQGAYEGVIPTEDGPIFLVEDSGGPVGGNVGSITAAPPVPPVDLRTAKQPNSFVYRFMPFVKGDLKSGGMLQVLQVESLAHAGPIKFGGTTPAQIEADILSQDVKDLHTYGNTFDATWVTIHNTTTDGTAWTGNANALAKAAGGTPFKRPENGRFRPGTEFHEFYFDETGDTDATTGAGATYGGFGAIFKLKRMPTGAWKLSLLYNAPDAVHAGFDNLSFMDGTHLIAVEDAGDTLHTQRNALDSAWMFDVNADYSNPANKPVRFVAEGRDPSATLDSGFGGNPVAGSHASLQNEGDNEITGFILSDGDAGNEGILGDKIPEPFEDGWRLFYTQQHGDNHTWEIISAKPDRDGDHDRDDRRFDFDHDRDDRR